MTERMEEAVRLAKQVAAGGIVQQATERLIYQIVEACAEHERERHKALVEALKEAAAQLHWSAEVYDNIPVEHAASARRIRARIDALLKAAGVK